MRVGLIFKLVISFTALLAFLMGLLVFSNSYVMRRASNDDFYRVIENTALYISIDATRQYKAFGTLDANIKDNLFSFYEEKYSNIWFRIQFNDKVDETIIFGNRPNAPQLTQIDDDIFETQDGWFDVHRTLISDGKIIGSLELAFRTEAQKQALYSTTLRNIYLGILEVLLGSVFALLISLWLINRLRNLEQASNRICEGDYGIHIKVEGNDEIAQTSRAFNNMSQELQKTVFELEKARNQFRSVFETAHDGILILDEDNKIVNANKASLNIFGYRDVNELLNKDFFALSHILDDWPFSQDVMEDLSFFSRKEPFISYRRDGQEIYIKISPSQFYFDNKPYISLLIQNVTKAYQNELRIIESEARFRTIINTSLDGMIILDNHALINLISPAAERILGISRKKAIGQNFIELILPKEEEENFYDLLEFYKDIQDHSVFGSRNKIIARRADGFEFPAEVTLTPLKQLGQIFFVIFIRDITAQQHSETLLLEARNQAEQANQAKSRFLAMMSHEIRTPIVGVIGILDLLADDDSLSQNQLHLVHQAQESSENLLSILNDVLDWSRVEQGKLELNIEAFSLRNMLHSITQLMTPLAHAKNLNLSIAKDENLPDYFMGDPGRLRQVLLNLLSNAIKFTEKGDILLKVSTNDKDTPIGEYCHLTFTIQDQGIGISQEDQKLLFKEFSQLDPKSRNRTGGTGLGLAISHHLIKLMGGNIEVKSELGKGTEFSFHLSFKVTQKTKKLKQADIDKLIPNQTYHILLVEDVKTNHFVIRKQLEEVGYKVSSAWDGLEAVNLCKRQDFDIILMDMAMPNMSGLEATQKLRVEQQITTPIIGLSAHAYDKDKKAAINAGMNKFLTKPVRKNQLLKTLAEFWPNDTAINPKDKNIDKKKDNIQTDSLTSTELPYANLLPDKPSTPRLLINETLIDDTIFSQVKEELGKESFYFILSSFSQDNIAFIENLKKSKDGQNIDKEIILCSAHSLKGSSSSLGLKKLSKAAALTEKAIREDDNESFNIYTDDLFFSWEETIAFIEKLL